MVVPGEVPLLRTQGGEQEQHAEVEHPTLVPTLLIIIVTVSLDLKRSLYFIVATCLYLDLGLTLLSSLVRSPLEAHRDWVTGLCCSRLDRT